MFSSRASRVLKAYPVTSASAVNAANALDSYCKYVLPYLGEKVECIQSDAGTQFITHEWKTMCTRYGLISRTCPVDQQAMNGQAERAIGILAAKIRALLLGARMHTKFCPLEMEADYGYKVKTKETGTLEGARPANPRTVVWRGDWDIFKEEFIAAAECSGTGSAVELAERLAVGEELENLTKHNNELVQKGRAESRRLKTQLSLSPIATQGAQQMLVRGGLERDMDGVDTWMRPVNHFEYTAKGHRTRELHTRWEGETLQPGEHPGLLYIRLVTLQRQLAPLGDDLSQNNLTRKFLAAL